MKIFVLVINSAQVHSAKALNTAMTKCLVEEKNETGFPSSLHSTSRHECLFTPGTILGTRVTAVTERDKSKRKQETGDAVHFNDGHTLGLSGAIGASSQEEIREQFTLIIEEMTLLWTGRFYMCVMQPFLHFLSSASFILVMTTRGKHVTKEHVAWTDVNISNDAAVAEGLVITQVTATT